MRARSTAKFVSYNLRPCKQCERKLMMDSLAAAMECNFSIPTYRYVGMGGNRFYDFILVHKRFGIRDMVSLEHDDDMVPRAQYNNPYKFIRIYPTTFGEFIFEDDFTDPSIYWMDYDGAFSTEITDDVVSLSTKASPGDFVFITVCCGVPRWLQGKGSRERLVEIRERFTDFANSVEEEDMENSRFSTGINKILNAALENSFVVREDGVFQVFFQVEYSDGVEMITLGGVFAERERCEVLSRHMKSMIPFLSSNPLERYRIRKFDLTEKERALFDRAATAGRSNAREINALKRLNFSDSELRGYRELLRYHPRYVETLL